MYKSFDILEVELEIPVLDQISSLIPELILQSGGTPELDKEVPVAGRAVLRAKSTKSAAAKVESTGEADVVILDQSEYAAEFGNGVDPLADETPIDINSGEESYQRPNGETYFARKWGDHSDVEVLRKAREADQYALLYGNPGTGKTAAVEAAFPEELYTILGSGDTEVSDLVGGYVQTKTGDFEWVDGNLVRAAEEGKVLLIDEIGLIDPKVLSIAYGLMDGRKEMTITSNPERGIVKAKEGFYVVAATNPNAAGVRLSEALLSRFTIQAEMTTDWERAKAMGVPFAAVAAAGNMSNKMETGEVSWAPQMRELLAFKTNAKLFGTKWAVQNLLASAPEMDRPVAQSVFARAFGDSVLPARI